MYCWFIKIPLKSNWASENVLKIPLLGITPREILTHVYRKKFTRMLIKMFIMKAKKLEIVPVFEELPN